MSLSCYLLRISKERLPDIGTKYLVFVSREYIGTLWINERSMLSFATPNSDVYHETMQIDPSLDSWRPSPIRVTVSQLYRAVFGVYIKGGVNIAYVFPSRPSTHLPTH